MTMLVPAFEVITCTKRQALITAGCPGQGLFVVRKGECHCEIDITEEDEKVRKCVKVVKPGDHFGELSLLEPEKGTSAHVLAANEGDEVLTRTAYFLYLLYSLYSLYLLCVYSLYLRTCHIYYT